MTSAPDSDIAEDPNHWLKDVASHAGMQLNFPR